MGKVIKAVVILLLVLIALAAVAILAVSALFDPNSYKQEITQAVRKEANIDLTINGEIEWSVYPLLGLSLNQVEANFINQPKLGSVEKASVAVSLPALFNGELEAQKVLVDGLKAHLIQNKDGSNNWTPPPNQKPDETEKDKPEQPDKDDNQSRLPLHIAGVEIINSRVIYTDERTQTTTELNEINFTSDNIEQGQPIALTLALSAKQKGPQGVTLDTPIKLQTELLASQTLNLNTFTLALSPRIPDIPPATLNADIKFDPQTNILTIPGWEANIANIKAHGQLQQFNLDSQQMQGSLSLTPFNLHKTLAELGQQPMVTADKNALTRIGLNASFNGDGKQIFSKDLQIQLDDTTLKGSASYQLKDGRIGLKLAGNTLDTNRYLPPKAPDQSGTSQPENANTGYSKEPILPLEPLRALNLDLALQLQALKADQLTLDQFTLATTANNGLIQISKLTAKLFGGQINNQITLDARKTPVTIRAKKQISGLQLAALLNTLTGSAPVTGTLNTRSDIQISGQSLHSFMNSMTGTAQVTLTNGVIEGINMAQELCQTINNLTALGKLKSAQKVDTSTPFAKMQGNFNIKNGIVSNNNLKLDLDAVTVRGNGNVSLPARQIDYRLGLNVQENLFKKTCPVNNKLEGIEWPLLCKGSLDDDPAKLCGPDTKAIKKLLANSAKEKLKAKAEDKIKKKLNIEGEGDVEDKIKEKLQEKLKKDGLKGLFK